MKTHGDYKTTEYKSWEHMIRRCTKPRDHDWYNYGGRGIVVCERWRYSYENFLADLGRKPTPKHTLDRKDNNGDYSPDNCRWATRKEQTRNRRGTRLLTCNGETLSVGDWAERVGMPIKTIEARLENGRPDEAAILGPKGKHYFHRNLGRRCSP